MPVHDASDDFLVPLDTEDATGDRLWDSGRLLQRVLLDAAALTTLQLTTRGHWPPAEVLELGAGTGAMACDLAVEWPATRYVATDLPQRVEAIESRATASGLQGLVALPLVWGDEPPMPACTGRQDTHLVVMADLIYFHGKHLLEPDTLEPLAHTLRLALEQRPHAVAVFTFRQRDPGREEHFRALCIDHGLVVSEPLDMERLVALSPADLQDVESSGPLHLWRIALSARPP